MRVRVSILLASLLLAGLAGCKGKAKLKSKVDMRYGAVRLMPGAAAAESRREATRSIWSSRSCWRGLVPAPIAARVAGSEGATKCEKQKPSH